MENTLLERIQEELEMIESIYAEDGVIAEPAKQSTLHGDREHVECILKLTPNTGFNMEKIAVIVQARFSFQTSFTIDNQSISGHINKNYKKFKRILQYPYDPPSFEFTSVKGLDDEQIDQIKLKFTEEAQLLTEQKKENTDETGFIYELHEKIREILTEYNDTVEGRCAVCLDRFCEDETKLKQEKFTDRNDLVRVDQCFHRFHLICVWRDWFMQRVKEKDQFGCEIEFKMPKHKRCPICRRNVTKEEIEYIRSQLTKHPEVDNQAYTD